jgi:hypothetical protein
MRRLLLIEAEGSAAGAGGIGALSGAAVAAGALVAPPQPHEGAAAAQPHEGAAAPQPQDEPQPQLLWQQLWQANRSNKGHEWQHFLWQPQPLLQPQLGAAQPQLGSAAAAQPQAGSAAAAQAGSAAAAQPQEGAAAPHPQDEPQPQLGLQHLWHANNAWQALWMFSNGRMQKQ